jgi:hypothetical protein
VMMMKLRRAADNEPSDNNAEGGGISRRRGDKHEIGAGPENAISQQ